MVVLAVRPLNAVELVANVSAPERVAPGMVRLETPFDIDEVETHAGTPPCTARTKPPVEIGSLLSVFEFEA